MTDYPNYQQLVTQFMEQWQRQTTGMPDDRELVRSMLEMVQHSPFFDMRQYDGEHGSTGENEDKGTEAAAGNGDVSVAGLVRRLEYCEARITRLEKLLESNEASPRKRSAKKSGSGSSTGRRSTRKAGAASKRS